MSLVDHRRFFFVHVHKAAGTSLYHRLQRHFEDAEIYPNDSEARARPFSDARRETAARPAFPRLAPTLLVSCLLERYRVRRHELRIVTGHFPLRTAELLGDEFTTLTLLREPVDRTLSSLRHHQMRTPADRDRSLEELYDDPIRFHGLIHNHQVKMFSLTPPEIEAGDGIMARVDDFTPQRLEEAKRRLGRVDVIGLHDRADEMCHELTARFGWRLGASVHANPSEPVEVARSFRARIESDNAFDIELYEHAVQMVAQRHS